MTSSLPAHLSEVIRLRIAWLRGDTTPTFPQPHRLPQPHRDDSRSKR